MEKKILLVDDEEGIRKVLGIALADSGYQVTTAVNGEEALRIFRETSPPIVLTDIKMPGMDGISLLRKIKQESPDTEVIMITGHGDVDLAIKSLQHQAIDFVTKPINDDVLEIALNRAVEKITMRRQLREYTENLEALVEEQASKLVEVERLAAVGQAIDGMHTAIKEIAVDLQGGIHFFNEMPCFVSIHNRELEIVEVNQLYRERFGNKIGNRSWEIYPDTGSKGDLCPVGVTFQTGKGQRTRKTIRYLNGCELPAIVHTAPIRNSGGALELVLEIAADLSEVNRLQEALRTTQQRYQQLFDEVPCYISVQDREFKLTATNRRFKEDFGERIGSHCYSAYKNRSQPCANCPVAKTFEDGKSHQSEMVVTSKSGAQYNVLVWTAPIRNTSGETVQVMEMATNITQIRQLQDHLTSLGFLISSISHGIKGLLTGLDGGMYMINSGLVQENREKLQEGWDVVQLMVDRIRNMVRNILFYAKERELHWEAVEVAQFAEDVCQIVEHKMHHHGIEFIKNCREVSGEFEIDPAVVRSALLNVMENAHEAVLAQTARNPGRITFSVHQENGNIVFDISDNGVGMDQETRENMFTLFFSSKGTGGTGLGLYITSRIVQQHGGSIHVETNLDRGTRFQIKLPRKLPDSAKKTMLKKKDVSRCS